MVDAGFGKHGVVLNLRLPQGRAIVADDDKLGCPRADEGEWSEAGQ